MYCDGRKVAIKDYPLLYDSIRNEYLQTSGVNGNEKISANAILSSDSGGPGTVYRFFIDSNKVYVEIYGREYQKPDGSPTYDDIVPNDASISFQQLNDFPGSKTWRSAVAPYNGAWSTFYAEAPLYIPPSMTLYLISIILTVELLLSLQVVIILLHGQLIMQEV